MSEHGHGSTRVSFGDVVRLCKERTSDPDADGFERYVGLEHIDPGDLRVRRWGDVADGTTFTNIFRPGQVLFGKRRAYQGKVAVADFEGVCSSDIYVLEPKDDRLPSGLLPFICQSLPFLEHAVETSAGSLSPRTNWKDLETFEFDIPHDAAPLTSAIESAENLVRATADLVRSGERVFRSALDDALRLPADHRARIRSVPAGWELSTLEDLLAGPRSISYGILKPGKPDPTGVPMLRVMDFDELGRRTNTAVMRVSRGVADTSKTTYLSAGDVIVSIMATIGRAFLVATEMEGWNVNRALAVLPFGDPEKHSRTLPQMRTHLS
jgi:type I restriction enzyme S subunit